MLKDAGSFFFSICEEHKKGQGSRVDRLQLKSVIATVNISTSLNMLRATLMVASSVPKEGATSGSNAGVVKLSTNRVLYSAKSIL